MKPADGGTVCAVDSVQMNASICANINGRETSPLYIGSHGARADCGAAWVVIADDPVNSLTLVIKRLSYADADFQLKYIIDTIIDIGLFNLRSLGNSIPSAALDIRDFP